MKKTPPNLEPLVPFPRVRGKVARSTGWGQPGYQIVQACPHPPSGHLPPHAGEGNGGGGDKDAHDLASTVVPSTAVISTDSQS